MLSDGNAACAARRQQGVLSRDQHRALGISRAMARRRVRTRQWVRVFPRVFAVGGAVSSWMQRAQAALLWAGPDAVLCRRSAAYLLGWTFKPPRMIDVLIPHHRVLRPPAPDVKVRRTRSLEKDEVTTAQGLRVTVAPRTLVDLAPERDIEQLIDAATYVAANNLMYLKDYLGRGRGAYRRGIKRFRQLVRDRSPADTTADSRDEEHFRQLLKKAGVPAAHHEVIFDENGKFIMESDFSWSRQKVIVEFDGQWHAGRKPWLQRSDAQQRLSGMNWLLIPVTRDDVRRRKAEVLERIRTALKRPV